MSQPSTHVALLRGVNVGGKNKLPMAQLRASFESLGCAEVRTYIQSGNVVFVSPTPVDAASLERMVESDFGIAATVVLRTAGELRRVVRSNPYASADPSTLHVGFFARKPSAAAVAALDGVSYLPDAFEVLGAELYLHLPNGMGRSKLPAYLDRRLQVPVTVRNWKTVNKLLELAGG